MTDQLDPELFPIDGTPSDIAAACKAAAERELRRLPSLRAWIERKIKEQSRDNGAPPHHQPFIAEFAGMPKAGKSDAIEQARHFFSHGLKILAKRDMDKSPVPSYQVHTPAEGVSLRTPKYLKEDLIAYNTWAGAYALQELLQAQFDPFHDLVLLDRGPWDAGCWLEYVRRSRRGASGDIDLEVCDQISDFFQLPYWSTQADLHLVFVVDPREAARRETVQRLIEHGGPATNAQLMEALRRIYDERFEQLKSQKDKECPLVRGYSALRIDTTKLHRTEVGLRVISGILDFVELQLGIRSLDQLITEEELWAYMEPFVGQVVRQTEISAIRSRLPEFVAHARLQPHQELVRERVKEAFKPIPAEVVVLSARGEAEPVIEKLFSILDNP